MAEEIATHANNKSPKNKGLIVGVGAGVAVAAVAGVAAFAVYRSQPQVVAIDAVTGLINAKNLKTTGTVEVSVPGAMAESIGVKSIKFSIDAKGSGTNALSEVTMNLDTAKESFEFKIGEGFMSDGKLYVQVAGIKAALENETFEGMVDVLAFFENTLEKLDGTWWEIDVPTVLDNLGDMIPEDTKGKVKTAYQCVIDEMNKDQGRKEVADLYRAHQFVNIDKYTGDATTAQKGGSLYTLALNADEMKEFANGVKDLETAKNLSSCFKELSDGAVSTSTDNTDFSEITEDAPEVILEIGSWGHDLRRIYIADDKSGIAYKADLAFEYPGSLEVKAPEGAKPVKEIIDSAIEEYTALIELENSLDD